MATTGCKELKRSWPVVSGLTAGTTKQEGRKSYLAPELSSKVPVRCLRGVR